MPGTWKIAFGAEVLQESGRKGDDELKPVDSCRDRLRVTVGRPVRNPASLAAERIPPLTLYCHVCTQQQGTVIKL